AEGGVVLAGVIVAAGGIDEDVWIGFYPVAFGQQPEQRLAGDLRRRVPHRHVDGADGHGSVAMAARFFIAHHRGPDLVGVQVVAGLIEQRAGFGFQQAGGEALPDEAALAISPVGIKAVADHRLAATCHIGDDRDKTGGHSAEVDIRVADRRADRPRDLPHIDDAKRHLGSRPQRKTECGLAVCMLSGLIVKADADAPVAAESCGDGPGSAPNARDNFSAASATSGTIARGRGGRILRDGALTCSTATTWPEASRTGQATPTAPAVTSSEVTRYPRVRMRCRSAAIQAGSVRVAGVNRGNRCASTCVCTASGE